MGKYLKLYVLALVCSMAFGCAQKTSYKSDPYSTQAEQRFRRSYEAAFDNNEQQGNQQLLRKARSAIGTPYVPGGMSPGGFDCSGFVCWAYKSVGVNLPRTAREQSVVGKRINNVEDMQVGDIVAFRHPRRGYHTGIYVGDGKFIHSPHRRTTVRINSLDDPYFKGTFLGARRVKKDGSENLVAEAESRLSDYAEEKAVRDIYRSHKPSHNAAADDRSKKNSKNKDKGRSKSRDRFVEVASLDKKSSSSRKSEVEKADKSGKSAAQSSSKSSSKSASKEDKSDKKNSASSSKQEAAKSEHKSESRKADSAKPEAKSETRKSESHKSEAAKTDSKSGASKSSASKGDSGKKGKSDSDKVASKSDSGKSKKAPEKKRDNNS